MSESVLTRRPVVAGRFYSEKPDELAHEVAENMLAVERKVAAKGVVSPHAGYVFSGGVAGATFSHTLPAEVYVVLGVNHQGLGKDVGVFPEGVWELPGASVKIDTDLADKLMDIDPVFQPDTLSHAREHSIEVQLPFIRAIAPEATFVPVSFWHLSLEMCRKAGEKIADAIRDFPKQVTVVASTDMTHYESHEDAKRKDEAAVAAIKALDPEELFRVVRARRISMCGVIPTTVMLFCVKSLGADSCRLIRYATSGEAFGDYSSVVGYAGLVVY